jgi:hypothetical protein
MAFRQELIDDTLYCRRRNGERAATRSKDGHAEYASLHVDDGASLRGRAERQIKADETVDGSAAKTVPSRSRECHEYESTGLAEASLLQSGASLGIFTPAQRSDCRAY